MELLLYWRILRRRLWLVAGLLALVLVSYLVFARAPQPSYTAGMRFVVGLRPEPTSGAYYTYDRYYTWLTAEYLLDDLAEVVKSGVFAQDVAAQAGLAVPVGAIQGATSAGKLHRILTVQITWPHPQELERIANATAFAAAVGDVLGQTKANFDALAALKADVDSGTKTVSDLIAFNPTFTTPTVNLEEKF